MEDRYVQIERENRLLLERMASIMLRSQFDNVQEVRKPKRSLNEDRRRKELLRIMHENSKILSRIQSRQSTYNHLQWEKERREQERYLRNISYFDNPWARGGRRRAGRRRRGGAGRRRGAGPAYESDIDGDAYENGRGSGGGGSGAAAAAAPAAKAPRTRRTRLAAAGRAAMGDDA